MVLEAGAEAPDFEAEDQNGEMIRISDTKNVILYFYPKDDTPGCTKEACGFRDQIASFKEKGWRVIGVSTDGKDAHARFAEKYNLNFSLVPDPEKEIARAYDVLGKSGYAKRVTYVIEDQKIVHVYPSVSPEQHALEVLVNLGE